MKLTRIFVTENEHNKNEVLFTPYIAEYKMGKIIKFIEIRFN